MGDILRTNKDICILIVTANPNETKALLDDSAFVYKTERSEDLNDTSFYNVGKYGYYNVVHFELGTEGVVGADAAQLAVVSAINSFCPDAVILIGIAFGKDFHDTQNPSQKIGDVLISDKVADYESGKVKSGELLSDGFIAESGRQLLSTFKYYSQLWEHKVNGENANCEFGMILSGDKVVDDRPFKEKLIQCYPRAIGGEMEGRGVYSACRNRGINEWIIVKAICDWADGSKSDNKENNQKIAAASVVSLLNLIFTTENSLEKVSILNKENKNNDLGEKIASECIWNETQDIDGEKSVQLNITINFFVDGENHILTHMIENQNIVDLFRVIKEQSIEKKNVKKETGEIEESYNLYDELDQTYTQICEKEKDCRKDISLLQKKIIENKSRNFMEEFFKRNSDRESSQENQEFSEDSFPKLLQPLEEREKSKNDFTGKHFTIYDSPEVHTIIYEVYTVIDREKRERYYEPELLKSTEELLSNGEVKRTFYVEDAQENGNQMIILHFVREGQEVYINRGLLIADEVKLSSKTSCLLMDSWPDSSYCSKEQWVETTSTKLGIPSIPIIDPKTGEEIVPELFYDENSESVKARVKIKTCKNYFSFRVSHDDGKVMKTLTNLDMGKYYLKGKYGFPKNLHTAIEFLEKDGSAEALYQIARIFFDDESVKDEKIAFRYLKKASEAGNLKAKTELAIYYWKYDKDKLIIWELIQEAADAGFESAQFLMGYLIETAGVDQKSLEPSFNWYYKAALQQYTPAQFRLKYNSNSDKKKIFDFFCESVVNKKGIADFCIGACILYGFGVHADVDFGLHFLNRSVVEGNVDAAYELLDYWEKNNNYQEVEKFCKLLVENPKVKLQKKFLNHLADGLNDIANEKGDKRYSEIALYVLNNM